MSPISDDALVADSLESVDSQTVFFTAVFVASQLLVLFARLRASSVKLEVRPLAWAVLSCFVQPQNVLALVAFPLSALLSGTNLPPASSLPSASLCLTIALWL